MKHMYKRALGGAALSLACGAALAGSPALTSPQTTTFNLTLTITKECSVGAVAQMNFTPGGGVGFITGNLPATTTVGVTCTNSTPANIKLNDGTHGTRNLQLGVTADRVAYGLFSDASHTTTWDATTFPAYTGNGSAQTLTIYGLVAPQATSTPGTYTDTVTVSVEF